MENGLTLGESQNLAERISQILRSSSIENAEEWAVHDYEYCGNVGEYAGINTLNSISEAFNQAGIEAVNWELFCKFCEHLGEDIKATALQAYQDSYSGSATTLIDWCNDYLEETGILETISGNLRHYFNVEAYARDLEINDIFTITHQSECHIFTHG